MHSDFKIYVKDIAIYLRKSRGESEADLINQRNELVDLCKDNNWNYQIYEEIVSGDTIEMRPVIQELLEDILDDLYDAILVVETDRLGRGKSSDMERIKNVLIKSKTLLCERGRFLDLATDQDEFLYDMRTFIARQEYLMIKRRLRRGKIQNAKRGLWSNGKPPLPYIYDKENKTLKIDQSQYITYRYIIDSIVLHRKNVNQIANELNRLGMKTAGRKGAGLWSGKTVRDTLIDQTHLGKIVIGKTKGNAHKRKPSDAPSFERIDMNDWKIYNGLHQPVKTQEEHDIIMKHLARNTKMPKKTTATKIYPLLKLLKCGCCGHYLGFEERPNRPVEVRKCWYHDPYGNKCSNMSAPMTYINSEIERIVCMKIDGFKQDINNIDKTRIEHLELRREELQKNICQREKALEKERLAYEHDIYDIEEYKIIVTKLKGELSALNNEVQTIKTELELLQNNPNAERLDILVEFQELM